ncbi:MAG: hypothetical protein ABFC65_04075, partial [Rectinema sp.]
MTLLPEEIDLRVLIIEDNMDDVELLVHQLKKTFRSVHYIHVRNFKEYRETLPAFAEEETPLGQYKV